jgi:hypothetical protein
MNEPKPADGVQTRLTRRVTNYKPELPRKLAALLPYKSQIKELRARNAAYDDIRLILAEENIMATLDAIYRFCRVVLQEKNDQSSKPRSPKVSVPTVQPVLPSPTNPPATTQTSIQAALQEQRRERLPGLWGRRKRGPRIADSKNL